LNEDADQIAQFARGGPEHPDQCPDGKRARRRGCTVSVRVG